MQCPSDFICIVVGDAAVVDDGPLVQNHGKLTLANKSVFLRSIVECG